MKKEVGAINLGLTFAGCFLGAGYVSGQELWQFFGAFGIKGVYGLVLAMLILFVIGMMMMTINRRTKLGDAERIIVMWDAPIARALVTGLEVLFLFGVCTIMSAGVGALFDQLLGIPQWIGSAVFAAVVAAISLAGFSGMIKALSATVPVLAVVTFIFGIMSALRNGISFAAPATETNALMGSWLIASVSFACYNIFGSIAIIAPLGQYLKSRKAAMLGIAIGTVLLFIVAVSVLVCVCTAPEINAAELPMLELASSNGTVPGMLYGFLLLLAMFGTSLSSLVGFVNMLSVKFRGIEKNRVLFIMVTAVAFFCGSLFGFGDLIGIIYPVFGYCSSVFIVLMAIHYFKVRKDGKLTNKA